MITTQTIEDAKGSTRLLNVSLIKISHRNKEDEVNFDLEATKIYNFLKERCSMNLFDAIKTKFAEEL